LIKYRNLRVHKDGGSLRFSIDSVRAIADLTGK
jgi:hypothetical protein